MSGEIFISDVTARDGKQSPGCNFGPDDTVLFGHQLTRLGVDMMEAGFPVSSDADFESVRRVAEEVAIRACALARMKPLDIEEAARALENAKLPPRIHVFISTSPVHMNEKLRMNADQVLDATQAGIELARRYVDDVQFSAEDATRTEFDFLVKIVRLAIESGATTINIPDTVGYATRDEYGVLIRRLIHELPIIRKMGVVISTHCHNDLGLATANTLLGINNGARQVEGTINGIGERGGNAHLAEIMMNIIARPDVYKGVCVNINPKEIGPTGRMLSTIIGKPISDTLPIVGSNAFAHSSGIHQHGALRDVATYEIINKDNVGWVGEAFPLTSQSGRAGLLKRLGELGYNLDPDIIIRVYNAFMSLAERKASVYNKDLHMLVQEELGNRQKDNDNWIKFLGVDYQKIGDVRSVTVKLEKDGSVFEATGTGNGPVAATRDAIETALKRNGLWPGDVRLHEFDIEKGAGRADAVGVATIEIRLEDNVASARGFDTDIVQACAIAWVKAINFIVHLPRKTAK